MGMLGVVLGVALMALAAGAVVGVVGSLRAGWWTVASVFVLACLAAGYEILACQGATARCEAPTLTPLGVIALIAVFLGVGTGRALRRPG